ncbi:hypothetical protein LSTR_LSTR000971 [Laodelphax striatellus]|uniref:Vacuole membrane protein 1 n=1 Tax=Laodelphax striatellus TaxID=195883 RepID=A0A482X250_LAOST|nr:hypothetical protein LSTR_LSTR000971 [Laodelphax striatellus]
MAKSTKKNMANRSKAVKKKGHPEMENQTQAHNNSAGDFVSVKSNKRHTKQMALHEKRERESIVLWRKPFVTLDYFVRELGMNAYSAYRSVLSHKLTVFLSVVCAMLFYGLAHVDGPHRILMEYSQRKMWLCLYWVGLGVLSSIGLGTGLHTFVLYLGPHIAQVTLAAYECGNLNFPEPPYPDEILCPTVDDPRWVTSLLNIMRKVQLEAVMWGAGTALGELPPYFMARAARLSGKEDEEDEELEELKRIKKTKKGALTLSDRAKLAVQQLVEKVGFFGILACASVPNPLFDLAGITCGHFLVPFWTFFGAVLIGKAVIKMTLQVFFVIVTFNDTLIKKIMVFLENVPSVGIVFQRLLREVLDKQKERFNKKDQVEKSVNYIGKAFEIFVLSMILYFVISIVNSLAQSYHKRLCKRKENEKSA